MVAAYDDRTWRVSELLLLGTDENDLMHRGWLALGADRYLVLPVFLALASRQADGPVGVSYYADRQASR